MTPTVTIEECVNKPLEPVTVMLYRPSSVEFAVVTSRLELDSDREAFSLTIEGLKDTVGGEVWIGETVARRLTFPMNPEIGDTNMLVSVLEPFFTRMSG